MRQVDSNPQCWCGVAVSWSGNNSFGTHGDGLGPVRTGKIRDRFPSHMRGWIGHRCERRTHCQHFLWYVRRIDYLGREAI